MDRVAFDSQFTATTAAFRDALLKQSMVLPAAAEHAGQTFKTLFGKSIAKPVAKQATEQVKKALK